LKFLWFSGINTTDLSSICSCAIYIRFEGVCTGCWLNMMFAGGITLDLF
jgi:hypothetical protein